MKNDIIKHREELQYEELAQIVENGGKLEDMETTPNGILVNKGLIARPVLNRLMYGSGKIDDILVAKLHRYITLARRMLDIGKTDRYLEIVNKTMPAVIDNYIKKDPTEFNLHFNARNPPRSVHTVDTKAEVVTSTLRKRSTPNS
jgi:hypothetical protein